MQVDGRLHTGQRQEDVVIHSLTANIGQFGFWRVIDEFIINVQDKVQVATKFLVNHFPLWKVTRN
jgi:hypothetical protein